VASFDFLPSVFDDSSPVYSGLFNEVMSSSVARYAPAPAPAADAEKQPGDDDPNAAGPGAAKKETPTSLEESLL